MESHRVQDMMLLMASKIRAIAYKISDEDVRGFITELLNAKRIYVMGAGRSGLVAKAFAMRLMHLGMHAYVVGETITPALDTGRSHGNLLRFGQDKDDRRYRRDSKGDRGKNLPDHVQCRFKNRQDCRLYRDHRAPEGRRWR